MATLDNLTFGHGIDEQLNEIYDGMPEAFQDDLVAGVAALLKLDEMFGLKQDGDYVLVTPAYMVWLLEMVTPTDPRIAEAIRNEDEEAIDELLVKHPFSVAFASPQDEIFTATYPKDIRGKVQQLRGMNLEEAEELGFMCTVRKDGTVIHLPGQHWYD